MIELKTSFETLQYKLPVPVRGAILSDNKFLKITLLECDYYLSILPNFHNSSLEELSFKVKKFFSLYSLNFNRINFSRPFFNLVEMDDFLSSLKNEVLFNIENLLLGMLQKTHAHLIQTNNIQINDLYRPERGVAFYTNSKCLKVKITPKNSKQTIQHLNELHSQNETLFFRLDGNRFFELGEFVSFVEKLEKNVPASLLDKIDYIEEPFKNFSDTYLFQKRSRYTIAMDESFSTLIHLNKDQFPEDRPLVAKPSLFGISTLYNWMEKHPHNRVIISSTFEHPSVKIGLDFLASKRPSEFHGLENFL